MDNGKMNTLGTRIRQRLEYLKESDKSKTQAGLAKYCKVKPPSVSKWLNGTTKTLQGQNLLRAAEYLECDPDWLATGVGIWALKNYQDNVNKDEITSSYTVKMLDNEFLKNYVISTSDITPHISHIEYTEDQYRQIFSAKEPSTVRISNMRVDNMSGTLEQGDLVFIDTSINKYDGDGIYLFVVGNHLHLKRLQMAGKNLLVISDNQQYRSWKISQKDKNSLIVIGKVLLGQSQIFQRF